VVSIRIASGCVRYPPARTDGGLDKLD